MDQPYGDACREYEHYEYRPTAPLPPWNERAYEPAPIDQED